MKCDWKGCGDESAGPAQVRLHEHDNAHPHHPHTNEYVFQLCAAHTAMLVHYVQSQPLHQEGGVR
jgi:hypothetical protein